MRECEIVECIEEIERCYPVEQWRMEGRLVWPLVKTILCDYLADYTAEDRTDSKEANHECGSAVPANEPAASRNGWAKLDHVKKALSPSGLLVRCEASDVMIFHHNNARNLLLDDGTAFDYNLDPFTLLLEDSHKILSLEYMAGSNHAVTFRPSSMMDGMLERAFLCARIRAKVKKSAGSGENIDLPEYDSFLEQFSKQYPGEGDTLLSVQELRKQVLFMNRLSRAYAALLRKSGVRFVIAGCGYGLDTMSLFMACRDSGVKCMEVQHGLAAGAGHRWYTSWRKMPKDSQRYEMLPDCYWVWSESDAQVMNRWCQGIHTVIPGCKPISCVMDRMEALTKQKPFPIDNHKKNVLLSLQPIPYPRWIKSVIEETCQQVNWIIRKHPRFEENQAAFLQSLGSLPNVYVEGMETILLEKILAKTSVHITSHSTVCVDALDFGVPSIIFGGEYADLFQKQIEEKQIFVGTHEQAMLDLLWQLTKQDHQVSGIQSRGDRAKKLLEQLVEA